MASVREIRRRIRSVRSITQVTRAMEMVAASRMRRAQEAAVASRPFAAKAWEILTYLASQQSAEEPHPLLRGSATDGRTALVVITSDRGLAGAYNSAVIRKAGDLVREAGGAKVITIGRKGRDFMAGHGFDVVASFADLPDRVGYGDITPITRLVVDGFRGGEFGKVQLVYTDFINVLTQRPTGRQLLPVEPGAVEGTAMAQYVRPDAGAGVDYIFEQPAAELLDALVPRLTEVQIYYAMLEARASEHSARMVAMRNATQNAQDLVDELTVRYNKARQEAITNEMLDIAGGAEALAQR